MNAAARDVLEVKKTPARWQADVSLAVIALVWGTTFVIVKSAIAEISVMYFLALRFAIGASATAILFQGRLRRAGRQAVVSGLRGGMAAGIFLWAGYVLQTAGLKYTTAGKSGFITGLYIVLVPVLSAVLYRRSPQVSEVLGIAVAAAGLALLMLPSLVIGAGTFDLNRGDLLTVGCAVTFAFHMLMLGYYSQRENLEAVAVGQLAITALLSALALVLEPPRAIWSPKVCLALAVTGLFATALALTVQAWAQQYTTATRAALIFSLEPVFALLTALGVGGERFSMPAFGGAALILGGILLVELKPLMDNQHHRK